MAFGFGFNKQKVLNSAEKYVQQGKMQNAIAEYEKVIKADPKDLTVTNTIGDLYSRLGDADKATDCFKTVGDAYAAQGFTVKAIAMYKKISKLKPSLESVLKLAELYTQQGLFNDARSQYLQVADEFIKSGELENAIRIFQKILEMDPENSAMRIRLAEVYVRLGKKTEAWQIFSAAAETLRGKGNLSGADEVLQRMLTLDPGNSYALLLQGRNLLQAGDAEGAIASLQNVPDLDTNPDGLRDLLKAYLKTGRLSDAGTLAGKLLSVHNDLTAISSLADALMRAGQHENALQLYDRHADRLLAEDSDKVIKNLHSIIGHVRDNPALLEKLLELFQKAGESTHLTEVIELLAHASVQSGDLPRARDLYQKLATVEPGNPLHLNHYQQVVSQLGGPSAGKLISADEAAVIVDELEATSPAIHQHYSDAVALAVRAALTDAELFISYNMPGKALGPLTAALPQAPNDLRMNQRLAALHTRAGRFAEAGVCCRAIQGIYSEAEYPEEATRYGELADRYESRAAASDSIVPGSEPETNPLLATPTSKKAPSSSAPWPSAPIRAEATASDEPEFSIVADENPELAEVGEFAEAEPEQSLPSYGASSYDTAAQSQAAVAQEAEEIDLSSEWDDTITVEAEEMPPPAAAEEIPEEEISLNEIPEAVAEQVSPDFTLPTAAVVPVVLDAEKPVAKKVHAERIASTIEEIRFYLEHGMAGQASAAFVQLESITSNAALLNSLRAEIEAASRSHAPEADVSREEGMSVSAFSVDDFSTDDPSFEVPVELAPEEMPVALQEIDVVREEMEAIALVEPSEPESATLQVEAPTVIELEIPVEIAPELPAPVTQVGSVVASPYPVVAPPAPAIISPAAMHLAVETQPSNLQEFVTDLESSLDGDFLPQPLREIKPAVAAADDKVSGPAIAHELEPVGQAAPTVFGTPHPVVMGEFVADLEASLGEDFLKDAPLPTPEPALGSVAPRAQDSSESAFGPVPPNIPAAAAAAASSGSSAISSTPLPVPVQSAAASVMPAQVPALIPGLPLVEKISPFGEEPGIDLSEMFDELRQDLESGADSKDEDPETHYNLGIAFREMGLLDEAIGELQKTCQAIDRGHPFPQIMQTYTWLAQCFMDKGVPEAAIRWYDKALHSAGIDEDTRIALYYELANAYERAGDKISAVKSFMEVYGRNIDYRDVAERIKALKS